MEIEKQFESEMVISGDYKTNSPNVLHRCREYCWTYKMKPGPKGIGSVQESYCITTYSSPLKAIQAGWKYEKGEWTCPNCVKKIKDGG